MERYLEHHGIPGQRWGVDTLLDNGMGGTAVYRKGIEFDEVVSNMLKYKG